ncbi:carboxypeptidase-like regulatory domain-containing protein [Hymenobacter sp. 5516J-16]|uniref:carboxypeptidase-like regulatory domain-containing protein n=1 Tax=Hymenobacter sp. 5516J-16 TaxID=2932253 RepID=UPI001FD4C4D6|nr:carboxypeptidase-like regulatory domain-containing protein [Hymenobacter sp. 5516J-16]UOQ75586.1 carboxypeptidase-like regulatory domain-containing protein [Hymenobacter sp. 5516J-16]
MRSTLLFSSLVALLTFSFTASAQTTEPATERLALATTTAAAAPAARLECTQFTGQVLNDEGKPLIGATVQLVGSRIPQITNSEGKFVIKDPVYRGQVLHVAAAGYVDRDFPLATCEAPVVGLELAEGTRIKRNGKHAGQIIRSGQAYRQ